MNTRNTTIRTLVEIIGIASVVASLVFVGLELRQNSEATREQSEQASLELFAGVFSIAAENPDLAELMIGVNTGRIPLEDLDRKQSASLYFINLLALQAWQSTYQSCQAGITQCEDFASIAGSNVINIYVRSRWGALKQNMDSESAAYLESIADL